MFATLIVAGLFTTGCKHEHANAGPQATPVHVHRAQTVEIAEIVVASGAIESVEKSAVAFMVPGRVVSVEVADGSSVVPGQVLARLDPADYENNVAIAEAQLREVEARHVRLSRMHESGSLTDTDFDKIDAALKQARAAAELAQRQLGYTILNAPFRGSIVKHEIEVGVVVAPAVPVFTLHSPGAVWANLGVSEAEIGKIREGQTVEVRVAAARVVEEGTIDSILPNADPLSRAFTVKALLLNASGRLRHGNVVVGDILTGQSRRAMSLPPRLVQKHPDGSLFVWLVDAKQNTAVRQIVETGVLGTREIEIASGLHEGDQVILNVPHTLFEGAHLTIAQ